MRQLLFIVLASLFIQNCERQKELPHDILKYSLTNKKTGSEAKSMVNRLHLQTVTNTENIIGFYKDDDKEAVIYISYYQENIQAENDLKRMVNKISPQNSVFIDSGKIAINQIEIYRYFGMGQTHHVFRLNNMLIWISVDTMIADEFSEAFINHSK